MHSGKSLRTAEWIEMPNLPVRRQAPRDEGRVRHEQQLLDGRPRLNDFQAGGDFRERLEIPVVQLLRFQIARKLETPRCVSFEALLNLLAQGGAAAEASMTLSATRSSATVSRAFGARRKLSCLNEQCLQHRTTTTPPARSASSA